MGPFRGAVVCTLAALVVVVGLWTLNYGGNLMLRPKSNNNNDDKNNKRNKNMLPQLIPSPIIPRLWPTPRQYLQYDGFQCVKDGVDWSVQSASQHNKSTSIWTLWRQAAQAFGNGTVAAATALIGAWIDTENQRLD